jgi:hypothetical protein
VDTILNRVHVAEPQSRDSKTRPAFIPSAVHEKRLKKLAAKAEKNQVILAFHTLIFFVGKRVKNVGLLKPLPAFIQFGILFI